ncbi:O-antigen ligase family protein [Methylobacterium nonmethylotrophicum]|uniref:O-antigen ligase domain-containing protein n=1 Tax=Methylobacterium nonmethylotrophicum TaxID=1141884 RepID=A0A4Z0NJ93_9HYPH|nr:O-antigen ligase family protein [Methylobacterium nonmethylotrophicum]TGD95675.1 O-antigen ligase domain-containing protein [Methylobacterium nonmethylotrophicum]
MLNVLIATGVATWFSVAYPVLRRRLAVRAPSGGAPLFWPLALLVVFAFMPLVFSVERTDGNAVLEQGLTASNVVTIVLTGLTGLYLAAKIAADRRVLTLPFCMPYLPFTLMIGMNALSAAWSIVPLYTLYRTAELAIFTLTSILIFDRPDIQRRLGDILAIVTLSWLVAVTPEIVTNLASGIVFSSAKNNMMPLVCAALGFAAAFGPRRPRRGLYLVLAAAGFVIAGSAASTGALIAVGPGLMIASRRPGLRLAGIVLALASVAVFLFLMVGLSNFPALLDVLSVILQKPRVELANATGRGQFWPTFIAATQDRLLGSGFSAADRFVQLLIPTTELADELGRDAVFITSSHNMFLSAWAGTGIVGLCFALVTLIEPIRFARAADRGTRRLVACLILMLALNGMTTPGLYQDWNVNVLAYVAVLAYARAARRAAEAPVVLAAGPVAIPHRADPAWPAA